MMMHPNNVPVGIIFYTHTLVHRHTHIHTVKGCASWRTSHAFERYWPTRRGLLAGCIILEVAASVCSKLRRAKKKKEKKSPKARQKLFHAIWCLLPAGLVGRYVPSWQECTQKGWQERSTSFCLPNAASPPPVGCSRIRRDSLSLPLAAAGKTERQKKEERNRCSKTNGCTIVYAGRTAG